jgi:signal transduction histidine kinase/ActR/RegA family two-component response regulator
MLRIAAPACAITASEEFARCKSGGGALRAQEPDPAAVLRGAIAAREHAEQALEEERRARVRAETELRAEQRRKDEFLATLAHELRNPLAPIQSAVQIMRLADGDHATAQAARAMIERQLKHLVRLIDDLMDVSRLTQGRLELRKERVALASVIESAVAANRPQLESKQHHLRLELPAEPLHVDADSTRLTQVFANLLSNAAKYSDAHGNIRIRLKREGPQALVTVIDAGIGIEPDMLARVFEPFTQVQRTRAAPHDGLGIGLTIAKRLVELHGGSISAHSEGAGRGSSFSVRLALLETSAASESQPRVSNGFARNRRRGRILIADDNFDAAQALALMLRLDGHEVRTASDGAEALRVADEFRPQVILLDIGMPKLDGYETARRLRARPWARDALLFAQTGWGQEDDKQRAKEAGFDRHLVKPLDPEALSELLMQTLDARG